MQAVDLTKPGERKKLIWAAVLGLVAVVFLWWALIGFGSSKSPNTPRATVTPAPSGPGSRTTQTAAATQPQSQAPSQNALALAQLAPIVYHPSSYSAPDVKRNIFAYYVPPPTPTPAPPQASPTPPPPPPPLLLASVSPSNVYARSADFKLEVAGDKFTPATKIYLDGRELPTTYISPQQLSTNVSASMIAAPGSRNVIVRNADNSLYSNQAMLSIAAPPTPNYLYVGIISPHTRVEDTALVQDKSNKNVLNVHRGDVLSGRFRVTSISEKELVMMDTTLKIKHTLAMTEGDKSASNPLARPTPRVESEDDEP
ncbi:MAG TPA: IPT/TIG domain-containing protein [Pyrinomonadaceae bacterium]|nr:IPT/TIG domain-containing protein [Pyrinomonadaceae bacterium]